MFSVNALRLFSFRVPRGPGCEGGIKFSYKKTESTGSVP